MKILITGGTGLLGKALTETAKGLYSIAATHLSSCAPADSGKVRYIKLDIRDREGYKLLFDEFSPDVVIHAAGVGSPDYAQKHMKEAHEINVGGTKNIIENCEIHDAKLIYISSNGIYDGRKAPYKEADPAEPINYYGRIKLEGENAASGAKIPHAVVRPILMYGWNYSFERANIVTLAISMLEKNKTVFAYEDVFVNPLFSTQCARAIWKMIEEDKFEDFNLAGNDRMSVYELVRLAASVFGLDECAVMPVRQGYFNELVKRPEDTSFDTRKMREVLGIEPISVEDGLRFMRDSKSE